jgi:hypothetical protein
MMNKKIKKNKQTRTHKFPLDSVNGGKLLQQLLKEDSAA